MKKTIIPLLLAVCLLSGCGDTGPWEMPQVDAAPTPEPTTAPVFSSASPESYIWNEIVSFNMSDPGVSGDRFEQELSHSETLALFGADFLPQAIFTESRSPYKPLTLKRPPTGSSWTGRDSSRKTPMWSFSTCPPTGTSQRLLR